ncbi:MULTISPECIES: AfsR/SARP family transcriptional regulator [Micromonospora]|uniref:AfsR/SARP family transcriptional regulator n=1 Tax=Micromonospora TaxID=1873 RepID=UPI00249C983E|nr:MULTISPECIES: AfsR/SARP family transcriptional regulator [Micromonospora]WFE62995.1 AfsR/SARP family transcriptional regulator [Micromonospora sp. WMMD714]
MSLGVLGPLSVLSNSVNKTPSARKPRNVLAMLLVHADQVVPVSSLISELWEDDPPVSSLTTLQTYILNLRKLFVAATHRPAPEITKEVLVTRVGGYMFRSETSVLDVREYDKLVLAGWSALADGDDLTGMTRLTEALRLWRGAALVDVSLGRVLESKRRELEESRLMVTEYLVGAKLRLGMYREVLTELAALTAENPLHEGLQAQYMRALHLGGRRAQALEVFHRLRRNLIDELGLEPESQVQRAYQAILNSDTEFDQELHLVRPLAGSLSSSGWGRIRTN